MTSRSEEHSPAIAAILGCLPQLRSLEELAARDPGMEEDHGTHYETAAYRAYGKAYRELTSLIEQLPRPEGWVEFFDWTRRSDHSFGDVDISGGGPQVCRWDPKALTLRMELLEGMLRVAEGNPRNDLWDDPHLQQMLAAPEWREGQSVRRRQTLADLIARCGHRSLMAQLEGDPIYELVEDLMDPSRLLSVDRLQFTSTGKSVNLVLHLTSNLRGIPPSGASPSVIISLIERTSGREITGFEVAMQKSPIEGMTFSSRWEETQIKVRSKHSRHPRVTLVVPREIWLRGNVDPGTELTVLVEIHWLYAAREYRSGCTIVLP